MFIKALLNKHSVCLKIKSQPNCETLELIDLINENHEIFDTNNSSWKKWKSSNTYLYRENKWLRQRFDEAVWEKENQQLYKYT